MVSDDVAKRIHAEELARQNAPSGRCGRPISKGQICPQIVKIGTLCPACGVRVYAEAK